MISFALLVGLTTAAQAPTTTVRHPAEAPDSVASRAGRAVDAAKAAAVSTRPTCPEEESTWSCTGWFAADGTIRVLLESRVCDGIVQVVDAQRRVVAFVHDNPNACSRFALLKADGSGYEIEVWQDDRDLVQDPDPTSSCAVAAFANEFPAVLGKASAPTIPPPAALFYVATDGVQLRATPSATAVTASLARNDTCFTRSISTATATSTPTAAMPSWSCSSAGRVVQGHAAQSGFVTTPVVVPPPTTAVPTPK